MKKNYILLYLAMMCSYLGYSQSLSPGDIAFIGYNTDAPDGFSFITLTDIPSGEEIYFTEQGWDGSGWIVNTETHLLYITPSGGLACGTIVYIEEDGAQDLFNVTGGGTCFLVLNTGFSLLGGDQILAYQSASGAAPADPSFIAGVHGDYNFANYNPVTTWNNSFTATSDSEVPTGLTNGVDCVSLFPVPGPEQDNAKYNGTLTGTADALRALINNPTNWIADDIIPLTIAPSNFSSPNVNCAACTDPDIPTVTYSPATVCNGSNATLSISGTLNDATAWQVYTGSCGGTNIGNTAGSTFVVTPSSPSTTYYVRGEGGCVTPGSCGTVTVTVTAMDDASFSYGSSAYCVNASDPTPTITGLGGGTFSSTAGLSINASTGTIDVSASTPNTYTVTYTTAGSCPNSSNVNVTINSLDNASFSYGSSAYCVNASDPTPTITGLGGGTFTSSPAGLSINASTGTIDVSASTPNAYTVTYTTAGTCPNSSNVNITINSLDNASFSYGASSYTAADSDPTPTITGLGGGTFTSSPAGLSINASTGTIDVSASTPNTYTVTYTTAGTCPNSSNVNVSITVPMTPPGNALAFDGVDDYVNVPGGGGLDNLQSGTIEMWVKWNGTQDAGVYGFGNVCSRQQNGAFSNQIIGLTTNNPSTAKVFWLPYDAGGTAVTGNTTITDNQWHHIAVTYQSGDHKLYIDGRLDASSTQTGTIANMASTPFSIGAWSGDGQGYSSADIDEVRIWNTIRSQTEIQMYIDTVIDPTTSGLLSYYRFDKTNPSTTLPDLTGNGNNGTLTNMNPVNDWVESYAMVIPITNTAVNIDYTTADINWTVPKIGTVENYYLEVAVDYNFTSKLAGYDPFKDMGTSLTESLSGLELGTKYYYRVRAFKSSTGDVAALSKLDSLTSKLCDVVASVAVDSNVTCNGYADGGMTASATGGTSPYIYSWSNAATTASITGIAAGAYSVTVTDQNGCTSSNSGTVTEPATLVAVAVVDNNVSCNGYSDGGMTASATGGTSPYYYEWSNAATTASITGIIAGTYAVTVTDLNGCYDSASVVITEPAAITNSITDESCETDPYILGTQELYSSGVYTEVFTAANGCDSTVTLTLTVHTAYFYSENADICDGDSLLWHGSYYSAAGSYFDFGATTFSCDSTYELTLTVNPSYDIVDDIMICEGDSIFAEGSWQTTSGTYIDSFNTAAGCDSIITTNLTVSAMIINNLVADICGGDSLFAEGAWQTTNGTYYDTLTASMGCDSIVIIELFVHDQQTTVLTETICEGDSMFLGGQWQYTNGMYYDTLASVFGCDSIIETMLTVSQVYATTDAATICEGDIYIFGTQTLTVAGDYTETLTSVLGCDSVVTLTLTVNSLIMVNLGADDTLCFENAETLTLDAGNVGMSYLWSDGSTAQTFVADAIALGMGTHTIGVTVTDGVCTTTDEIVLLVDICSEITSVNEHLNVSMYPNPTKGKLNIAIEGLNSEATLSIMDVSGRTIMNETLSSETTMKQVDLSNLPKGIYAVKVVVGDVVKVNRIVIQ